MANERLANEDENAAGPYIYLLIRYNHHSPALHVLILAIDTALDVLCRVRARYADAASLLAAGIAGDEGVATVLC